VASKEVERECFKTMLVAEMKRQPSYLEAGAVALATCPDLSSCRIRGGNR